MTVRYFCAFWLSLQCTVYTCLQVLNGPLMIAGANSFVLAFLLQKRDCDVKDTFDMHDTEGRPNFLNMD